MDRPRYALSAEGIRKSFGHVEALKAASLSAEAGKVTTLLGRNGSGKTTLMRIAAGLLRPDQGTVALNGCVVRRPRLSALARQGVMFLPLGRLVVRRHTVRDHFRAVGRVYGDEGVAPAVDLAAVGALLDQRVETLSGGEHVRVSLGLAFARRPTVLLADEPLVGLAPIDQERLGQVLRAMASEGVAVVTSGHDTGVLLDLSDVILWSAAGTTHHIGSPAEAVRHDQFRREYLGPGDARGAT